MSVALVRRMECVANVWGSSPMPTTHLDTSRAYWRVVKGRSWSRRPGNRYAPGLRSLPRRSSSRACRGVSVSSKRMGRPVFLYRTLAQSIA